MISKYGTVKNINNIYTNQFIIEGDKLTYKDLLDENKIKSFIIKN